MRAADDDTPTLPEDAAALRALLLETRALVDTLVAERDALASQNERLQHLLLKLKRRQFGRSRSGCRRSSCCSRSRRSRRRWPRTRRWPQGVCRPAGQPGEAPPRGARPAAGASAARRGGAGARGDGLPLLPGPAGRDRRRCGRAARRDPRAVPRRRDEAAEAGVPRLPRRGRAGAGAGPPDRGRGADRGDGRACAGLRTPITCRCIARRRSWRGRASRSAARCWPTGPARRRTRSCPSCAACGRSCWARRGCSPTRPPCRCSIPAAGRTKKGYAWAIARDDRPWAARIRRRWCSTTPRAAAPITRTGCSAAIAASCNATATGPTRRWPRRVTASRWRSVGRTLAGSFHRVGEGQDGADRAGDAAEDRCPLRERGGGARQASRHPPRRPPGAKPTPCRRPVRLVLGTACTPARQQPDRRRPSATC